MRVLINAPNRQRILFCFNLFWFIAISYITKYIRQAKKTQKGGLGSRWGISNQRFCYFATLGVQTSWGQGSRGSAMLQLQAPELEDTSLRLLLDQL